MCSDFIIVSRVALITGHLQKIDSRKLSKTLISKPKDMFLSEKSNQVFLPGGATDSKICDLRFHITNMTLESNVMVKHT